MRIGYYAHHHGSGHCRQADKLAALLPAELRAQLTVFTSLQAEAYTFTAIPEAQIIRLSPEDECTGDVLRARAGKHWQPDSLHYSPVGNRDIQARSHQILQTIYQRNIDIMIVDLSVEIAMLCRTISMPFLYVRLPGIRDDLPHLHAFSGALALLAAYPQALEADATPDWVRQKTLYLDFLDADVGKPASHGDFIEMLRGLAPEYKMHQRLQNVSCENQTVSKRHAAPIITVIKGFGGHEAIDMRLPELRRLLPDAFIISLGPIGDQMRRYVDIAAYVDDVTSFIAHSDWLLMACGLNGIAQAYYHDTPLIVQPDERPHNEQEVMAEALIAQGRAISWTQFVAHITHDATDNISALSTPLTLSDTLPNKKNTSAAPDFINSMATCASTKRWFEDWLLPRLALCPNS
jgi:hypothetical protein